MRNRFFLIILFVSLFLSKINAQNLSYDNAEMKPWLSKLIETKKLGENQITDIKSSTYKGKNVFLVNFAAACCDQYSAILLDEKGQKICSPFGGISGKGDMKCPDFSKEKSDEIIVWVNENIEEKKEKKARSFKLEKAGN